MIQEKINALAAQKSFKDLLPDERALVLSEMSAAAFDRLGAVLQAAATLDSGLQPPPALKTALLQQLRARAKPRLPMRALAYRIPLWQAACLLGLLWMICFFKPKDRVAEKIVTRTQVIHDTIWQEKTIWKDRMVWREKVVFREKPPTLEIAEITAPLFPAHENLTLPETEVSAQRVGTSLGDAPELMRFFTQGDK